jgi:hypothetical protein
VAAWPTVSHVRVAARTAPRRVLIRYSLWWEGVTLDKDDVRLPIMLRTHHLETQRPRINGMEEKSEAEPADGRRRLVARAVVRDLFRRHASAHHHEHA